MSRGIRTSAAVAAAALLFGTAAAPVPAPGVSPICHRFDELSCYLQPFQPVTPLVAPPISGYLPTVLSPIGLVIGIDGDGSIFNRPWERWLDGLPEPLPQLPPEDAAPTDVAQGGPISIAFIDCLQTTHDPALCAQIYRPGA